MSSTENFLNKYAQRAENHLSQNASKFESYQFRAVGDFLDTAKFSVPEDQNKAMDRLKDNINYFLVNYGVVFMSFLVIPLLLVGQMPMLGLLLADGAGSLYIFQQNQPLKLGEHQIPAVHAIGVVNTLTILLSLWLVGPLFFTFLGFAIAIVLVHAVFRERMVHGKIMNFVDGALSGN